MKIGLISDLHGNLQAAETVFTFLNRNQVEVILCAGDLVGFCANPNEVIDLIKKENVISISGNYDDAVGFMRDKAGRAAGSGRTEELKADALRWAQEAVTKPNKQFLKTLPWLAEYHWDGHIIKMLHAGMDYLDRWYPAEDSSGLDELAGQAGADILILGHTHQAFTYQAGRTLIVNPGAVGRSLDGDVRACCAILDTLSLQVTHHRLDYDLDAACCAIRQSGMHPDMAVLIGKGASKL